MASIGSLTGSTSSSSSIYGNRTNNMVTGLMSGMDTESMIEGLVQSYQQKIQGLQQDRTTLEWQQSAYQSISDKLVEFSRKYMSYTSNTNLLSSSFFNSAFITTTGGKYADLVSATGKSDSTILLNSVSKLATTARYSTSGKGLDSSISIADQKITVTGGKFELDKPYSFSNMDGSLTLTYGNQNIKLTFGKDEVFQTEDGKFDGEAFENAIKEKLKDINVQMSDCTQPASRVIDVKVDQFGTVTFSDKSSENTKVYISEASGNLKDFIKNYDSTISSKGGSFDIDVFSKEPFTTMNNLEYLSEKTLSVTLDGKTKTITMPTYELDGKLTDDKIEEKQKDWIKQLQTEIDNAFGSGKITMGYDNSQLSFTVSEGTTLSVTSSDAAVNSIMGLGGTGLTSYLNTQKTLEDLFKIGTDNQLRGLTGNPVKAVGEVKQKLDTNGNPVLDTEGKPIYVDEEGNTVVEFIEGWCQVDENNKAIYEYDLTINGTKVGSFSKDTELNTILNAINNSDAGVNASYSKITGEFVLTAKDSGSGGRVELGSDLAGVLFSPSMKDLGWIDDNTTSQNLTFKLNNRTINVQNVTSDTSLAALENSIRERLEGTGISMSIKDGGYVFTDEATGTVLQPENLANNTLTDKFLDNPVSTYDTMFTFEAGQDAEFNVTINGKEMPLIRSSNSFEIDGMTITLNGTFNADGTENEPVTFTSKADTDTIVDTIKTMVDDYNTILSEVKKAYSDMPLTKSDKSRYEPLTDADKEDMSDSAIESYEEKAKTGILFMDSDLSALYGELRNAISSGSNAAALRSIGINTEYSDGLTTITLDETALRQALEQEPDKVQNIFTQSKEYGATTDGLMTTLQNITDKYAATTGANKGILIEKAGSKYAPTSALQNELLDKMNDIDDEISTWQDKMSDKVDYYTNKFTQLEMLINEMNSQSSALSGLLGG